MNSGNDGDLPLASEPEELSGDQPPLTQLKRIIFVAVALLAVASVIVVQSWRQTRNESKNGATPSSGSSTNQGHASPSLDRQSALTVGTGYELNADSGTRVAAYSFLIRWTGDDPLEVRYDGTGLPPGLRYVPGRSAGASILLRRGQTVTLTLDFRITDCCSRHSACSGASKPMAAAHPQRCLPGRSVVCLDFSLIQERTG